MKKKVYEYICNHPKSNTHEISANLGVQEVEVLQTVLILEKDGYVTEHPAALSEEVNDSCRYSAGWKKFSD